MLGSLASALAYPHDVDRYLELVSPRWSRSEVRAAVLEVRRETADATTLVLRTNARWRGHRAGQYVALSVDAGGVRRTRCFSISSAPAAEHGRAIEVTVKARPGGLVSPLLAHRTRPGAVVVLSQAQGDFVLPDPAPERVLFVSGGSGVTPVMALTRALLAAPHAPTRIMFVHFARSREDVIFATELERIARRHADRVRVVVETERDLGRPPAIDEGSLAALAPDYERWDAWACGPPGLLDAVRGAYEVRGEAARVRVERFQPPAPVRDGDGDGAGASGGHVRFARSSREATTRGETLLVAAERSGLSPASGCRMGICRTCTCRKVSGTTRDLRSGELRSDPDVDVQLCVSAPVGDVTLDL